MQHSDLFDFMLDSLADLADLHAAAASTAERVWSMLAEYEETDFQSMGYGDSCRVETSQNRLRINSRTYTVEWDDLHCHLGPTIFFKLIKRLACRPGCYLTYDILMENVWQRRRSAATIRSAVKRLRKAMRDAGMVDLANAIKGKGECYGLLFPD